MRESLIFLIILLLFSSIFIIGDFVTPKTLVNETFPYYNVTSINKEGYVEKISVEVPIGSNFPKESSVTGYLDIDNRIQIAVKHGKEEYDDFCKRQK
jgi:hypothetical protein